MAVKAVGVAIASGIHTPGECASLLRGLIHLQGHLEAGDQRVTPSAWRSTIEAAVGGCIRISVRGFDRAQRGCTVPTCFCLEQETFVFVELIAKGVAGDVAIRIGDGRRT